MLHAVAELSQHGVRDVERVLRDEVHADALGAHQPHHLLDAVEQRLRRVREEEVRLVEEEHEPGLVRVADLGHPLVDLGQKPQQHHRVEHRRLHQAIGSEDVDHAAAGRGLQQVVDVEHRLAQELRAALLLEHQQAALDRADRRRRHVAVPRGQLGRVLADEGQHRPQVLEVEQQQAVVVGDLEHDREHAGLHVVEHQHPPQQQRAQVGHGRPQRDAGVAEHVEELHRHAGEGGRTDTDLREALAQLRRVGASLRQAGEVALDVGGEHRHADRREALGHHLQAHRLAGAGGAGDEAVTVGHRGQQGDVARRVVRDDEGVGHGVGKRRGRPYITCRRGPAAAAAPAPGAGRRPTVKTRENRV